jgi:hypothetical protein
VHQGRSDYAIRGDAMINGGRRPTGPGERARARLAARQAENLYPGALGRLVAQELTAYADRDPSVAPGGFAELVVREVLERTPPRARRATARFAGPTG